MMMHHPSSVVESHSVQSQFTLLTKERERLQREIDASDRDRRCIDLTSLRELQVSLGIEIQKAHTVRGLVSQQKDILQTEVRRLKALLQKERSELEHTQTNWSVLNAQEKHAKMEYVTQMHVLNADMEHMVQKQEVALLSAVLASMDGVDMVKQLAMEHNVGEIVELDEASSMLAEALAKHDEEHHRNMVVVQQLEHYRSHVAALNPVSRRESD
jgi:hypothetical protein